MLDQNTAVGEVDRRAARSEASGAGKRENEQGYSKSNINAHFLRRALLPAHTLCTSYVTFILLILTRLPGSGMSCLNMVKYLDQLELFSG